MTQEELKLLKELLGKLVDEKQTARKEYFPFLEPVDNDPCNNCNNNPKNGGSGICLCTLGQRYKITC